MCVTWSSGAHVTRPAACLLAFQNNVKSFNYTINSLSNFTGFSMRKNVTVLSDGKSSFDFDWK